MTISLPTLKLQGIQKAATRLLHQKSMTVKDLAQLIGMLVATKQAVHTRPLYYHALQHLTIQSLRHYVTTSLRHYLSYQKLVQNADWESQYHDSSYWQLLPSVFEAINNLLGPFNIDLFASRTNTQLPVYCSWRPDPQAKVVDAFSVLWSQDCPYLSLPFNLIGRALTKICQEELEYACLIAPVWPAQVWYPQLLKMLVGNPVLLPMEQDLLLDPGSNPHPLILEGHMFLTAWPVSGKPTQPRDILTESLNCYSSHGEEIPTQLIT